MRKNFVQESVINPTLLDPTDKLPRAEKEILAAWHEYRRVEKYGIAFGRICYHWQKKLRTSGGHGNKHRGIVPMLESLSIPISTAYWWIDRYKKSIVHSREPKAQPARNSNPVLNTALIQGDAFNIPIADETFQLVITSPPYFGLRSYEGNPPKGFGLEETVDEYVGHSIQVLREVRRVLRSDGICFWVVGDSYDAAKNLRLIPERIAIEARNAGWIVRDIIIWAKPNCVPESVADRCTRSYETILMLAKNQTYFWNSAEAVEPSATGQTSGFHAPVKKVGGKYGTLKLHSSAGATRYGVPMLNSRNLRNVWNVPTQPHREPHIAMFPEALAARAILCGSRQGDLVFDPFAGSGTTGIAAQSRGRRAILMDVSASYVALMKARAAAYHDELCGGTLVPQKGETTMAEKA
jgi:DNA modification methylase